MHKLEKLSWVVAIVVIALVILMFNVKLDIELPFDNKVLPKLNAVFNSLTFVSLILAVVYIKRKDVKNHNRFMNVAMGLSAMFLISYVMYHFTSSPVKYGDIDGSGDLSEIEEAAVDSTRYIYFFILATHIILAALILPFTLVAYVRGHLSKSIPDIYIEKHRKLVKIIYPLWLYVALSGPIVYLMLSKYY